MWMNKKLLKQENAELKYQLDRAEEVYSELVENYEVIVKYNDDLADKVEEYMKKYPFDLGQTVYDVKLRSASGRFTKTKAAREHSVVNEVVVDKKNYFTLVDRFASGEVFTSMDEATEYLNKVCVE